MSPLNLGTKVSGFMFISDATVFRQNRRYSVLKPKKRANVSKCARHRSLYGDASVPTAWVNCVYLKIPAQRNVTHAPSR